MTTVSDIYYLLFSAEKLMCGCTALFNINIPIAIIIYFQIVPYYER